MKTRNGLATVSLALFAISMSPAVSEGAVLAGNVSTATGSVDLTAIGTISWAVWNYGAGNTGTSLVPSNRNSGAPTVGNAGFISSIGRVGGVSPNVRGGNASLLTFNYNNGASTLTFSGTSGMVFPSNLDSTNQGTALSITGNTGQVYQVSVWAGGFAGQGRMTASLTGATDVVLDSQVYNDVDSGAGAKGATLFTYTFQPNSATDTLNLSYVLLSESGVGNSHVGISAVAVALVPEPSSFALVAAFGALGLMRRRR